MFLAGAAFAGMLLGAAAREVKLEFHSGPGSQTLQTFSPTFVNAMDVPMTGASFDAPQWQIGTVTLGFMPQPGQRLTAFKSTVNAPVVGRMKGGDGDWITGTYGTETIGFHIAYAADGSVYLHTYYPGMPDLNFNPLDMGAEATAVGPWRRILSPTHTRMNFLRKDGTVDGSMPFVSYYSDPSTLLMQDDGKFFSRAEGSTFRRFNVDGTPDSEMQAIPGSLHRMTQLSDGRLVCSFHSAETGVVIRFLLPDGTPDPAAQDFPLETASWALAEQDDGKILVAAGGSGVHRLNRDGTVDASFQCTTASPGDNRADVSAILPLPDGKILMGGHFESVNGVNKKFLARLNTDGSTDESYDVIVQGDLRGIVTTLMRLNDGRVFAGGDFNYVRKPGRPGDYRYGLICLMPDGTPDEEYRPMLDRLSPANRVRSINMLWDGSILLSGTLRLASGPLSNPNVRRFLNTPVVSTVTVVPGAGITWTRNGEAADFAYTSFEYRGDGESSWTPLGKGVRAGAGNWFLSHTGALPASGFIRVRGRLSTTNRAPGVVMESHLFGREELTAIEQWREDHFGDPVSDGPAANHVDADRDGIGNLAEYGLGLDPRSPDQPTVLPAWISTGDAHEVSFTPPSGLPVTYGAEWSTTLHADDWHVADELPGDPGGKAFRVPHDAPGSRAERLFFRLRFSE
ncbi:MAG: delta-60 repeat domain-containing protein [Akkermansiaceae bacterium]|nr:delta-60 repeat domain-containing protein [Akkermansiaceae bacterium]